MVNTSDSSLIDILADQVLAVSKEADFFTLNKEDVYVVMAAISCSESTEET